MKKNKILLVEGAAGIGKSTLIDGVVRKYFKQNKKIRTFLNLTQAHTYGPLAPDEDKNTLSLNKNLAHLEDIYKFLHFFASCKEKVSKFFCIIETLHITHCFRPGIVSFKDIKKFDRKLSELNCKLVFIKACEETIWKRTVWGRRDNQFIKNYGKKFGKNLKEIHNYFVSEQEKMEKVIKKSCLKTLTLSAETSLKEKVKKVYNFWMK